MGWHHDEETRIRTDYDVYLEGIEVDFNDSLCPGATISLYKRSRWTGKRELLFTTIDCPKVLRWTPAELDPLWEGNVVEIEYWEDGYMRREELVTEKEADEIASRAAYDGQNEAHIAVPRTLSVGTSTVWFKVERARYYDFDIDFDVSFCVEFASSEDCIRFLHEDMRKLEDRAIGVDTDGDVAVIDDIMRALDLLYVGHRSAEDKAASRSIPFSQFVDECPQPEKQLIQHRASNRGDDRPCFLTLHLSTRNLHVIHRVDWSATTIPPTFPSPSGAFQSLKNLHLKFPSHDRNSSYQDDLTITIAAREISFLDVTNSVSAGNPVSINSVHRTVNINYINNTGDAFLAPISGGNVGGRNNVNTLSMAPPSKSHSPIEHSRAQGLLLALARRRAQSRPKKAEQSTRGVGRSVKARTRRARPS